MDTVHTKAVLMIMNALTDFPIGLAVCAPVPAHVCACVVIKHRSQVEKSFKDNQKLLLRTVFVSHISISAYNNE